MSNQNYKIENNTLYKLSETRGGFWKECVLPKRIKTLEDAIQYANTDAEQCGMSICDDAQY